jgi:hypothetical protein
MAQVVPFTSAAKMHRERIMNLSWTPSTVTQLLTTGANTQIKAYPYLRSLLLHVYPNATTGGGNLNASGDMPWSCLSSIGITDTNGSGIYGGQTFTGFDAYVTNFLMGERNTEDPTLDTRSYVSAGAFEFWLRIPFEYNPRTGAGALPNMSANATYGLQLTGNTLGNIWQTAPTTTPVLNVDVWMENWTLPDPVDLLGRNQMQGPPLLGTTQYVTKQNYPNLTTNGANTVALTRKGNMLRKWIFVTRGGSTIEGHAPRVAIAGVAGSGPGGGSLPNPFEFWWDGNRLSSDDPKFLLKKMIEEHGATTQASSVASLPTGVCVYDFSAPFGRNWGGDGEGGWLATTQSSRLELVGSNWFSQSDTTPSLDVITMDVAPIALANQYALDSATGKLLYPAQPEVRGG